MAWTKKNMIRSPKRVEALGNPEVAAAVISANAVIESANLTAKQNGKYLVVAALVALAGVLFSSGLAFASTFLSTAVTNWDKLHWVARAPEQETETVLAYNRSRHAEITDKFAVLIKTFESAKVANLASPQEGTVAQANDEAIEKVLAITRQGSSSVEEKYSQMFSNIENDQRAAADMKKTELNKALQKLEQDITESMNSSDLLVPFKDGVKFPSIAASELSSCGKSLGSQLFSSEIDEAPIYYPEDHRARAQRSPLFGKGMFVDEQRLKGIFADEQRFVPMPPENKAGAAKLVEALTSEPAGAKIDRSTLTGIPLFTNFSVKDCTP